MLDDSIEDLGDELDYEYDSDYDSDCTDLTAQEQWEESIQQINGLINWIIFPLIGKVLGRRFSKVIWSRIAEAWWPRV